MGNILLCMTILGMDSLLGRYIHFVKRNFKPILTKEAEKVISSYYQLQRRSATQNAARTTVRMLESLIRLAQVHARLMFRNEVTRSDAITAILCIESSMTASAIVDSVGNALHSNFTHLWVPVRMEKESPSTMLWTLFYLVQHYDRRGQYDIALAKIDEAIEHTPTVIDLYSVKGRILKHAGDLVAAAALADEVRCMDLADRYVNSECVKRMLEADQVSLAEKTAVLFTKDGDQHKNLHDMQCMWYELASGESYFRPP